MRVHCVVLVIAFLGVCKLVEGQQRQPPFPARESLSNSSRRNHYSDQSDAGVVDEPSVDMRDRPRLYWITKDDPTRGSISTRRFGRDFAVVDTSSGQRSQIDPDRNSDEPVAPATINDFDLLMILGSCTFIWALCAVCVLWYSRQRRE